jgi:hypothetical protein
VVLHITGLIHHIGPVIQSSAYSGIYISMSEAYPTLTEVLSPVLLSMSKGKKTVTHLIYYLNINTHQLKWGPLQVFAEHGKFQTRCFQPIIGIK